MPQHEVIDLSLDSDTDNEHDSLPGKTNLAAWQPRTQKVTFSKPQQERNIEEDSNHYSRNAVEEGSLVALLKQEVQKSLMRQSESTKFRSTAAVENYQTFGKEWAENVAVLQEQRMSTSVPVKNSISVQTKRLQDNTGRREVSTTAQTQQERHVRNPPVLKGAAHPGHNVELHRQSEEHSQPMAHMSISAKPPALPAGSTTKPEPFRNTWTINRQIQGLFVDTSESSAPEAVLYSDEVEPPQTGINIGLPRTSQPTSQKDTANDYTPSTSAGHASSGPSNRNGLPYTLEEDRLLKRLKEEDGLNWDEIVPCFQGRTRGSLQVRYSTKVSRRCEPSVSSVVRVIRANKRSLAVTSEDESHDGIAVSRLKRHRKGGAAAMDGFVSWASLKPSAKNDGEFEETSSSEGAGPDSNPFLSQDRIHPKPISRLLRQRELGLTERRAWSSSRAVTEEIRNHAFADYGLQKSHHGTSGDVVALSWSADGARFAAGSIAITDNRSMQYNMQRNLLLGNTKSGELLELVDHHIARPKVDDAGNVNRLHAMVASQDPRLFTTVAATGFSTNGDRLYTAGNDAMLRVYSIRSAQSCAAKCRYAVEHSAAVDLLAVKAGSAKLVATGCHSVSNSITILRCRKDGYKRQAILSPTRSNLESKVDIFPSALKWGVATQHEDLLLAGFSGDEDKEQAGETCLWDGNTGQLLELYASPRNVSDVAWNPLSSSSSMSFAIAADPSGIKLSRGMHTGIHCFALNQNRGRRIMTWECPAVDINDLVFSPHDENLVAAGATDGCVYVWDIRFADQAHQPLHILPHDQSENVLAHDRPAELADTGVRFLSWGATKSRLYSGSSDGIVKIWNPYRAPGGAHVEDLEMLTQRCAAIMSGAFSPDHKDLLIGTENGQINQFHVGSKGVYKAQPFVIRSAESLSPLDDEPYSAAHAMIKTGQIAIRPFGAMPIRQAVQGPNYQGPFLAPTKVETTQAYQAYQGALDRQHGVVSQRATQNLECGEHEDVKRANKELMEAQQALNDIEERFRHFHLAQPKAEQFQQSLRIAEKEREALASGLPSEPCKLDCSAFPGPLEIEDSGRADLRIPDTLCSAVKHAVPHVDHERDQSYTSCFPTNLRWGKRELCAACRLRRAALTSTCARCAGSMRVELDKRKTALCERCSFACFRCSRVVDIRRDMTAMHCSSCDLEWSVGVLGYELVSPRPGADHGQAKDMISPKTHLDSEEEFGIGEREYYASLWV